MSRIAHDNAVPIGFVLCTEVDGANPSPPGRRYLALTGLGIQYKTNLSCRPPWLNKMLLFGGSMFRIRTSQIIGLVLLGIVCVSVLIMAQAPPTGPVMRFAATTANISGAPDSIRIDVLAWSTDMDRDQMLSAWNLTAVPAAGARGAAAAGGGGGGRGARGGGVPAGNAPEA